MKKTNLDGRKLALKTETLMPMQRDALAGVRGGADTAVDPQGLSMAPCFNTRQTPCTTMVGCQ